MRDFEGAIKIVRHFTETGGDYRGIARFFFPDHVKTMVAVVVGNGWTNDDIKRWKIAIKKHGEFLASREIKKDNTIITKKRKNGEYKGRKKGKVSKRGRKRKPSKVANAVRKNGRNHT